MLTSENACRRCTCDVDTHDRTLTAIGTIGQQHSRAGREPLPNFPVRCWWSSTGDDLQRHMGVCACLLCIRRRLQCLGKHGTYTPRSRGGRPTGQVEHMH
eukprot:scaffold285_cov330-Pavlova_lutheri.AAC.116